PNIFETLVLKPLNLVFAVLTRFEIGLIVTFFIPFQTFPENVLIALKMLVILFFIFVNLFLTKFTMYVIIFLKNDKTAFHILEITLRIALLVVLIMFFLVVYLNARKSRVHSTNVDNKLFIPILLDLYTLFLHIPV